ncbi:MAG TPA: ABC transporter ATP-binding protein [Actinomycetes bacterium]|nr:ABC transporter ATP-binding protein [Actinomycetes bacterium]
MRIRRRAKRAARAKPPPPEPEIAPAGYWEIHNDEVATATFWSMLRRMPQVLRAGLRLSWQASRLDTWLSLVLQLAAGVLTGVGLLATTGVLEALFAEVPSVDRVREALPSLLLVAAAAAGSQLVNIGAGYTQARLEPRVLKVAELRLFELSTTVELAAFHDHEFHDAMRRARDRGVDSVRSVVRSCMSVFAAAAGLSGAAAAIGVLHPALLPLLALTALPVGWASVRAARMRYASMYRRIAVERRKWMLSDLMADRDPAAEVRAFDMRDFLLHEYGMLADRVTTEDIRLNQRVTMSRITGSALGGIATGVLYVALGALVVAEVVPLAAAGTAVLAIQTSRFALRQLVFEVNRLYEEGLYFGDYTAFCADAHERRRLPAECPAPIGWSELVADGVSFTYPDASSPALDGVTVRIPRGHTIALVGENGSGKTTLAKLLAGLYRPDSGQVRWGDLALETLDSASVWRQVALIEQDITRWPMTLRLNITMGSSDRGDAVTDAAHASGADAIAAELPQGYDTLLAKEFLGGQDLSGGQWQRVAVARGFYRQAELLICDEPTAALDARAEHAVYNRIRELSSGRTVLLITHRLASVRSADLIYVLEHGKVTEVGNHAELLARDGTYAEMYRLQARAYQDDMAEIGTKQPA